METLNTAERPNLASNDHESELIEYYLTHREEIRREITDMDVAALGGCCEGSHSLVGTSEIEVHYDVNRKFTKITKSTTVLTSNDEFTDAQFRCDLVILIPEHLS